MDTDTPNFDSLARLYRWMEYLSFGPLLQRCRLCFVNKCSTARQALILGDGDGRFTARLMAANVAMQVDAVDSSAGMLVALRHRVQALQPGAERRLHTMQADLRRWSPDRDGYDLVVSHFFLDCLVEEDVAALLERLQPHLSETAIWLVSEFAVPETVWARIPARLLIRSLYIAFFWMTGLRVQHLPDYATAMERHGFIRSERAQYLGGILVAEIWKRHVG